MNRATTEATARVGGVMAIPAVLRCLGADPGKVFADARVDLDLFDDPDSLISFAARGRLVRQFVAATACPHFGLLVGQGNGLANLGLVGLLVKYSPDVGTALRSLVRHFHLRARGAVVTLALDGDLASLGYEIYQRHSEASDQIADGALATQFNFLRELCGPDGGARGGRGTRLRRCQRLHTGLSALEPNHAGRLEGKARRSTVVLACNQRHRQLHGPCLPRQLGRSKGHP